jgi:hypothetical protein
MEFCIESLTKVKCPNTKRTLETLFRVFGIDAILRDSGFYLTEEVVSAQAMKNASATLQILVKKIASVTNDIIENMNVPTHALYTPIAADYV